MVLIEFRKMVHEEGAIKKTIITGLAEMMGTSLLVFLGCMGCVSGLGVVPSHLQITLNFGLSVMIVIQVRTHSLYVSIGKCKNHKSFFKSPLLIDK